MMGVKKDIGKTAAGLLGCVLVLMSGCTLKDSTKKSAGKIKLADAFSAMAKPSSPEGLTATPGPGYILLQWTINPSIKDLKPVVHRWRRGERPRFLDSLPAGLTSYKDSQAVPGIEYFYSVVVKTESGVESFCNGTVRTAALPTPETSNNSTAVAVTATPPFNPNIPGSIAPPVIGPVYSICPQCGGKGCAACNYIGSIRVN